MAGPAQPESFAAQLQTISGSVLPQQMQLSEADAIEGNPRPAPFQDANALAGEQLPRGQHAADDGQREDEHYQQQRTATT
ncbi:hypothetical protein D3C78_1707030 [compost metagenome]